MADPVTIQVAGKSVRGTLQAADGQVVGTTATLDADSRLRGLEFRVAYPARQNFVDVISLRGELAGGALQSTDCGCGQYRFSRE